MDTTESWSDEGQALAGRLRWFEIWAWAFVATNLATVAVYLYIWSVLARPYFSFSTLFVHGANYAWMIPLLPAIPAAMVGLGWISAAFRVLADPADEDTYSGEKIALGFVFPGLSFVRPPQILMALHKKSCQFVDSRADDQMVGRIAAWVAVFWAGRLLDVFRTVARNSMGEYKDFAYVAGSAVVVCALNITFILLTLDIFRRVFKIQSKVLKDPKAYERKFREMTLSGSMDPEVPPPAEPEPVSAGVPAEPRMRPEPVAVVEDEATANPFSLQGRREESYLAARTASKSVAKLHWTDILFSSAGRLSRGTFVKYSLILGASEIGIGVAFLILSAIWEPLGLLSLLAMVPVGFAQIVLQVKRWHDHNKSGWMIFVGMIPMLGLIYTVVMLFFVKGNGYRNAFGSPEQGDGGRLDEDAQAELDFYSKI